MLPIEKALALTSPSEIIREIQLRRKLLRQMVGSLYPNIVVDEVGQLVTRYDEVGGKDLQGDLANET